MINSDNYLNTQTNQELFELLSQYFAHRGQFLAQIIRADLQSMSRFTNHNGHGNHNGIANHNGNGHGNHNGHSNHNGVTNYNGHGNHNGVANHNGHGNHNGVANHNGHGNHNGVANYNGHGNHNGVTNHNGHGNHNGVANYNGNGHGTVQQNQIVSSPVVQPVSGPKPVVQQQPPQPIQPISQPSKSVEAILVNLVVQQTGYPQESIDLELKLLDDLNLDSIKAGELVAAAAKECGVAGKVDPSALANANLKEVAAEIRSVMPVEAQVQPSIPVSTHNNLVAPAQPQTAQNLESSHWVRNFAVEYVAEGR